MKELWNRLLKKYFDYDIVDHYLVTSGDGTCQVKHIRKYKLKRRRR